MFSLPFLHRFARHKLVEAGGSPARLLLRELPELLASQPWMTGPLTDITTVLDKHLHHLRLMPNDQW